MPRELHARLCHALLVFNHKCGKMASLFFFKCGHFTAFGFDLLSICYECVVPIKRRPTGHFKDEVFFTKQVNGTMRHVRSGKKLKNTR